MVRFLLMASIIFSFWPALPTAAQQTVAVASCGNMIPCETADGQYFVHMPSGVPANQKVGAIFFLHGHRGKAENEIRNKAFLAMADELGVAFVAVSGLQGTWSFPTAPRSRRDEFSFFDQVIADLTARFPINRDHLMLSGFSSGAFMTWYLACDDADRFAGYAPISGAFWEPLPEKCRTHTPYLYHVHGTADKTVPLAGRYLGGGAYKQGDVYQSFSVWLRQAGLTLKDGRKYSADGLNCTRWEPKDGVLELCLHGGGHSVRAEWIKRAWLELSADRHWGASASTCKTTNLAAAPGEPARC